MLSMKNKTVMVTGGSAGIAPVGLGALVDVRIEDDEGRPAGAGPDRHVVVTFEKDAEKPLKLADLPEKDREALKKEAREELVAEQEAEAAGIAGTRVLQTWLDGEQVYPSP